MNGYPLYDHYMYRAFQTFRGYNNVLDINEPKTVSKYLGLSKTCVGIGMNWMHEPEEDVCAPEADMFLA